MFKPRAANVLNGIGALGLKNQPVTRAAGLVHWCYFDQLASSSVAPSLNYKQPARTS